MGNVANRLLLSDYLLGSQSPARNYIKNQSGFYNVNNITDSGTVTTRNTTTPLTAISDIKIVLDATTDYSEFALNAFDNAENLQNCEFRGSYSLTLGSGATVQAQVVNNSAVIATLNLAAGTAQTFSLPFICSTSNTTTVRFAQTVTTNQSTLNVANLYVGKATNLSNVSQAKYIGNLNYSGGSGCYFGITTSWTDIAANASCNAPTVSGADVSAPGTRVPQVIVNTSPGIYKVELDISNVYTPATGGGSFVECRIADDLGTVTPAMTASGSSGGTSYSELSINGYFTYTTSGSRTFKMQCRSGDGSSGWQVFLPISDNNVTFNISKFPNSSQLAITPDTQAMSWSGYHDYNCAWVQSSGTFADFSGDSTCTFAETKNVNFGSVTSATDGNNTPGIVFTPKKAGNYYVCAIISAYSGNGNDSGFRLSDGTNILAAYSTTNGGAVFAPLCGIYTASSTASVTLKVQGAHSGAGNSVIQASSSYGHSIDWNIVDISQNLPSPLLVGSVSSNTSGQERIERAIIAEGVACSSSPCTITRQSGSWLSSVTRSGTGVYSLNFTSSIWSAPPSCVITSFYGQHYYNGSITTSAASFTSTNISGTATDDRDISVICMGAKA